ncbi:ABC transporter permease [Bacillus sp. FJAT-50079]|uniref:ABC transporter permease n=1 Tax=Bacillus sp. FJAT-50079 TaxID=2833577 RepID=UPI001BC93000|nr:ABC transporter permease [Bacillus sp. FJAT-50079]MBS4208173.1 ABC transporter permease [Bacillus sp. FJAT-50079]
MSTENVSTQTVVFEGKRKAISNKKKRLRAEFYKLTMIRLCILVSTLLIWEFVSGRFVDKFWISSPTDIMKALYGWAVSGELLFHLSITVQETIFGFILGALLGGIVGFVLGRWTYGAKIFEPFIMSLYSLPKIALAPLFILWFGIGIEMKILLAAITVFFLVFINTFAGVRNVEKELLENIRIMGASERQITFKVVLPSALTWILIGLRTSVPYALIGAVVGEITASNRGVGYLIQFSAGQYDTGGTFAALIVLMLFAICLNFTITSIIEKRFLRWKTQNSN